MSYTLCMKMRWNIGIITGVAVLAVIAVAGAFFYFSGKNLNQSVVVLAVYHKPAAFIQSDIVKPIWAGHKLKKRRLAERLFFPYEAAEMERLMLKDDVGENISDKNGQYSELTAVYWAWKNYEKLGNPAFIGLVHYRRQLLLKPALPAWSSNGISYFIENIGANHLSDIGLELENILRILSQYDVIVHRTTLPFAPSEAHYDWRSALPFRRTERLDYAKVMEIVESMYPEFAEDVRVYSSSHKEVWSNMFIMPKHLFMQYAEWLFSILSVLENGLDFTRISKKDQRILGLWAEELTGVYVTHLERQGYKIYEGGGVFIGRPTELDDIIANFYKRKENL